MGAPVAVDMRDAPEGFGLPAWLREAGVDVDRVPLSPELAEDYAALARLARGPRARSPWALDDARRTRLIAAAKYFGATDAIVRSVEARLAREVEAEERASREVQAGAAAWSHLQRVPFGRLEADAEAAMAVAVALDEGDFTLLEDEGARKARKARKARIRLRERAPTLASLPPEVRTALLRHPKHLVLAGGAALAACAEGVTVDPTTSDFDLFVWGVASVDEAERIARDVLSLVPAPDNTLLSDRAVTVVRSVSRARRPAGDVSKGTLRLQVILRAFRTPDAVLHSFDLPACKVLLAAGRGRGTGGVVHGRLHGRPGAARDVGGRGTVRGVARLRRPRGQVPAQGVPLRGAARSGRRGAQRGRARALASPC